MPLGDRPDNLFAPVEDKAATHGIFGDQARPRSYQLWATTHRPLLAAALAGTAGAIAGLTRITR